MRLDRLIFGGFQIVLGLVAIFAAYVYWTGMGPDLFWRLMASAMGAGGAAAVFFGIAIFTGALET